MLPVIQPRACGPCDACCVVFEIEEPTLRKPARERCAHLATSGCSTYATRPPTCRAFECLWLRGAGADGHRPDACGYVLHEMQPSDGDPFGAIVVATEVTPGALADGSPGYAVASEIGAQARVIVVRADGTRRGILPVRAFRPEDVPEHVRGALTATVPMAPGER